MKTIIKLHESDLYRIIKETLENMYNFDNPFDSSNKELLNKGISFDNDDLLIAYGLSNVTLLNKGDYVTLTHFIVKERNSGNGTKFMEDFIKNADNNGWILVLTPDTSFGASSILRLKKFYKRFGFKENKGKNIDFSTRETMIRPNKNF